MNQAEQLPQLIEVTCSPGQAKLALAITPGLSAFAGHFDKLPIVPGVVQIQWALAFARLHIPELASIEVEKMESIKFHNIITPHAKVTLNLEHRQDRLYFLFTSDGGRHSSGKLVIA